MNPAEQILKNISQKEVDIGGLKLYIRQEGDETIGEFTINGHRYTKKGKIPLEKLIELAKITFQSELCKSIKKEKLGKYHVVAPEIYKQEMEKTPLYMQPDLIVTPWLAKAAGSQIKEFYTNDERAVFLRPY